MSTISAMGAWMGMASLLAVGPTTKLTDSDLGKPKTMILSMLSSVGLRATSIPREKIEGDFYAIYSNAHSVGQVEFCDDGTLTGFSEEVPGNIDTFTQMSAGLNKTYGVGSFVATSIGMDAGQLEVLTVQWTLPAIFLTLSYQVPNGDLPEKLVVGHGDNRKCWAQAADS